MRRIAIACVLVVSSVALARVHPRFEPTDLELETSGVMELDAQLGIVRGPNASRIVAPDLELDLGLLENVELDLDGAFAIEGAGDTRLFDHRAVDNSWASVKLGLYDSHGADHSWALGVQVGPKLPFATGAHGIGVEGLVLLAQMTGPLHLVLGAGGLVDPHDGSSPRPVGLEAGLDLEYEIVPDRWSFLGELGGVWYHSNDDPQLSVTAGLQYSPTSTLDLSIVVLGGFLAGSDPFGVLFGISPKFTLW